MLVWFLTALLVLGAALSPGVTRAAVPVRPSVLRDSVPGPVASGLARSVGPLPGQSMMRVVIGLREPPATAEARLLAQLQNRTSPLFHRFLTASPWNERFAPSAAAQQVVTSWLAGHGITVTGTYSDRLVIDTAAPAAAYAEAFGIVIDRFRLGARSFYAPSRPAVLPASIGPIVECHRA